VCGLAGLLNNDGTPVDRDVLARMIHGVRHRGPDETGFHLDPASGLGLAHARLSIIAVASGQQPMSAEDGKVWIVFNGEIFNYVELRAELQRKGIRFDTESDTEVLLRMYLDRGEDCVLDLNGQWAFAIWDGRRNRLFLSRDRVGKRPLFYTRAGRAFIFASEIKALLRHPGVKASVDLEALADTFTFWCPLPSKTMFEGILELPPGHSMVVEGGQLRRWQHWRPDFPTAYLDRSEDDLASELLELLTDATRIRLRSDVPVGAYLSGGLDSSVIAALVAQISGSRLRTFSVTFEDREFDESGFQTDVIRLLGTSHEQIRCTREEIGRAFPEVVAHAEKPVLRTAPAPMYLLSGLVRDQGYKVVLTGEGSDEFLGGYDIFKEAKIRRFWARNPESSWRPALLRRLYPYMQNLQAQSDAYRKSFFHVNEKDLESPFFSHLPRWELTSKLRQFLSQDVRSSLSNYDPYRGVRELLPAEFEDWDPFSRAQFLEATVLLPGYILSSQGDRMAMAHSVEGRFPFLDHRVIRFAAQIPPNLRMKVLNEKYLLKRAVRSLVPPTVLNRPKQPYRAPDIASFFDTKRGRARFSYVEELLSADRIRAAGLFNPVAVQRLVEKAKKGLAIGVKDNMALVGVLSTQIMMDRFFGR